MKNKRSILAVLLMTLVLTACDTTSSSSEQSQSSDEIISEVSSSESSISSSSISSFIEQAPLYTISFYTDGNGTIADIVSEEGKSIQAPSDPFRSGYDFDGWYEDYGAWETPFIFNVMPNRNLVLYAKWAEQADQAVLEYRAYIAELSKPNHLYIHYRRFNQTNTEYSNWDIWVWPENGTGRIVDFVRNQDETVYFDENGGAMIELDLTSTYNDGGHDSHGNRSNETVSYMKNSNIVDRIGFLITYKPSRTSGTHWISDGGDKFLVTADAIEVGPNQSLHIYAVQENVKDFTYIYGGEIYQNPYETDDGTNVSAAYADVDSSGTAMDIASTSQELDDLGVGYQIMVASFADSDGDGMGDIRGIINNMDYFEYLNIEALWLTPIQLSDSYHGYDIIDYRKIDTKFGSRNSPHAVEGVVTHKSAMLDYIDLLQEAKLRDMKIVMDLVVNHTSINNVLFQESLSLNPEYRAYYHWVNHNNSTVNQFWHPYSTYDYSFYGKFASSMPELNYDYQATRDVMVDIMDYWSIIGVSGFRIDAVKHVYMAEEVTPDPADVIIKDGGSSVNYDSNLTKNLHFFRELNGRLKQRHPESFIVGENFDGHAYRVAPYYEGLDSMLNFYMYYNLMQAAALGDRQPTYRKAANVSGAYIPQGGNNFVPNVQADPSNPDSKVNVKYGGAWNYPGTLAAYNRYRSNDGLIANHAVDGLFTSNHDLIRPVNKVIAQLAESGELNGRGTVTSANASHVNEMALATMAAVLLLPGLSWIYYGDELGMSSNLPSGATEGSSHADRFTRQPFKWDATGTNAYTTGYTFSGDKTYAVEWDTYNATLDGVVEQQNNATSMLNLVKSITDIKANHPTFKLGAYAPLDITKYASNYNVFAFTRSDDQGTYTVLINMSNSSVALSSLTGDIVLSLKGATKTALPAWSVLVIK